MEQLQKCPKCGSAEIGEGELDGHAPLFPAGKSIAIGSKIKAEVCTDCGYILGMYVQKPENFK